MSTSSSSFLRPWARKLAPGIPEAKYWAVDPAGVNQAGTVYSVQGFETQHVGVIWEPDLVIRDGRWVAQPRNNFSRNLSTERPEIALPYLKRIYRTLLSWGSERCRVYW